MYFHYTFYMLNKESIGGRLNTETFGRQMEILSVVGSTNDYLKTLSDKPEGYCVVADGQTEGRGRLSRKFYSPKGQGVYLSVLLKPQIPLEDINFITLCAGAAVHLALSEVCGLNTHVKWVNDIFFEGKKICGILTETSVCAENSVVNSVITGIGINTGTVAAEVSDIATSVYAISGQTGIRNELIASVLNFFEKLYFDFVRRGDKKTVLDIYNQRGLTQ